MKIILKPVESRRYTPLATPDTALQYHIRDLRRDALKRQFTLEIPDQEEGSSFFVIKVKPQGKVEERIQVFDKNFKYISCSCDWYIKNQSGFCIHLAALLNAKKFGEFYNTNTENYFHWRARLKKYASYLPDNLEDCDHEVEIFRPSQNLPIKLGKGRTKEKIEAESTKKYYQIFSSGKKTHIPWLTPELEKVENITDQGLLLNNINLYDYQREVFKKMIIARRGICSMIMGSGKCQDLSAKLLTPSGWTTIGQIKVGDFVIGSNGTPTKVVGVFPQGQKNIYKITFTDDSTTNSCDEHLWSVRTPQQKYRNGSYKIMPLGQFKDNLIDQYGNHKYHIPMVNAVEFEEQKIDIDPYLLGLLLGDGCISAKSVGFSTNDDFIVKTIKTILMNENLEVKKVKNSKYDYRIVRHHGRINILTNRLRELKLMGKKSFEKYIPAAYKYNSPEVRLQVLQGLMDTDGYCDKAGKDIVFYSTSEQLAMDVQELAWSFGGTAVIKNKQTQYTYKNQKKNGLPSFAVYLSLPPEIIPFQLPRKLERHIPRTKYQPTRYFKKVEYLGKKPAQCIAVDAKDHLYVTDDYIVTHNTLTTIACYAHIDKLKTKQTGEGASLLVVAPKSLKVQWEKELLRAYGIESYQINTQKDIEKSKDKQVCIISYQLLTRNAELLKGRKFDVAVVDEIQFIRNEKTKTWKALSQFRSDYFFGLSGTIIENRLDDLYAIMNIIDMHILGPKWRFDDTYQRIKIKAKEKIIYHGVQNLEDLKNKLQGSVFSYDNLKLPPITHDYVQLDIDDKERKSHDYYQEEAKKIIAKSLSGEISFKEKMMIQGMLLKARQSVNSYELLTKKPQSKPSNKIKTFLDLIEQYCVKGGEKVVVFSEWTQMLDILAREYKKKFKNIDHALFTGKQNPKQRTAAVVKFQTDPNCKIFFASDAGGIGLDGLQLVSARVIHTELPWNPAKLDQRTARVHRIGQKNPVEVKYLVSKATIEEEIYNSIVQKRQLRVSTLASFNVSD